MLESAAATVPRGEASVHPTLGYPPAFAKLCQCNFPFFAVSSPRSFLPYSVSAEDVATMQEVETLFPCEAAECEQELDSSTLTIHTDFLWSQLDHLGNAGFDPSRFRVDPYGNVLDRSAVLPSPLAWTIDHWFPQSRGGKTVVGNLRIVQWQVVQRKGQQLEFLIPSWDLQLGISINQFLNIFASKYRDFRLRAFALLFPESDVSNYSELESHCWPETFEQKSREIGFAAAAIVKVRKHKDCRSGMEFNTLKVSGGWNHQQWQEDGTTLLSTQQSYRLKNWVERMSLSNREADGSKSPATSEMEVQILNGCEKELVLRYLMSFLSLQQEKNVSLDLNHKIQHTKDQIALLETELKVVKQHNEREKVALEQLEEILEKHKKRVEKQHHWSESQSHYRQCLERIIRDTLHQSSVYKEKSRLNQAACTALLARIRSHRMSCDDAEQDLVKQCREREALEILAKPALMEYICRCLVEQGFLNHGSIDTSAKMHDIRSNHCEKHMDVDDEMCTAFGGVTPKLAQSHVHKVETHLKPVVMCMDTIPEEDEQKEAEEFPSQLQRSPLKRKVTCGGELDVHVDTFQRYKVERIDTTSQAPNAARDSLHNWEGASHHLEVNMQIDELLQEVLTLQDRTNEISADKYCEESEEQRVARLGKQNLDKWLQKLLLESSSKKALGIEKLEELHWKNGSNICYGHPLDAQKHDKVAVFSTAVTRVRAKKGLGRLFQRMSFRHDAKKKLKLLNEETNEALHDVQAAGIAQQSNLVCCNVGNHKANQADHLLSSTLNRIKVDDCLEHVQDMSAEWLEKSDELMMGGSGQNTDLSEEDDEAPNELDFVRRMRELRDEHATKQNKKLITTSESNKMADDVATREFESCHVLSPEKLEEKVKECSLAGFGKVSRSYSMRSSGSGGRWVLHTRKGSDVFPSTIMEGDHSGEEVEIVLQPSSSFRREHDVSQLHEFDADYPLNGSYGNMGLRASLRTCTRAWKRAMSKRNINYPGNIKQ